MVSSVYLHIPFCRSICSYCDFCKMYYHSEFVARYLQSLKKEIQEVYQKEPIRTLYIGGGTPSCLHQSELEQLFQIVSMFDLSEVQEFTFEMNPEDITEEKLVFLKTHGVNRISIGHETKNDDYLSILGRKRCVSKEDILLVKTYFSNINIDLMYGFSGQTIFAFIEDLDYVLSLDVPHISTYSLILEEHTKLFISKYQRLNDENDARMYEILREKLSENGYKQYEISNFSKEGFSSFHNLTYWNNEQYYGFGLGASGYLSTRYTNTRSLDEYEKGFYKQEEEVVSLSDQMIYEMILGLRKVEGVAKIKFFQKYHRKIEQSFDIIEMLNQGLLEDTGDFIRIPKDKLYLENSILIHFLEVKNYE